MDSKMLFVTIFFFSIFLYFSTASSFDVLCKAGGPYVKNATNNTFIIFGNVTNTAGVANVTVNISVGYTKYAEKNLTADQQGYYSAALNASLDVGTYNINVSAERNGTFSFCNDQITVQLPKISTCLDRIKTFSGILTYAFSGQPISSGTITASVVDTTITNSTSFSSGLFNIALNGCYEVGKRYMVQVITQDQTNKVGYSYIAISG